MFKLTFRVLQVGRRSKIKYIVLQVHYASVERFIGKSGVTDDSGVFLEYTTTR